MTLKIESNVAIPVRRRRGGGTQLDDICNAIKTLEVGQSFVVSSSNSASYVLVVASKLLGRSYIRRTEGKGCRVWRIA